MSKITQYEKKTRTKIYLSPRKDYGKPREKERKTALREKTPEKHHMKCVPMMFKKAATKYHCLPVYTASCIRNKNKVKLCSIRLVRFSLNPEGRALKQGIEEEIMELFNKRRKMRARCFCAASMPSYIK